MYSKIISVFFLLAMLNFIVGCSTMKKIEPSELKDIPEGIIAGATLNTGEVINFRGISGKFDERKRIIYGITMDNTITNIDIDNILYFHTKESPYDNAPMRAMDYESFKNFHGDGGNEHIFGVVLKSGDTMNFNKKGGILSQPKMVIWGSLEDGASVEFGFDEIQHIIVKRFAAGKTLFLAICILPPALFIAALATYGGDSYSGW